MTQIYEAWGLEENDEPSIANIRECATVAEAIRWAHGQAEIWRAPVNLYRVPYYKTGSAPWQGDQMQFICRVEWPQIHR